MAEKVRTPTLCLGCGKPRPDRASPTCPDCVLEERRLAAIAKVPPRPPLEDDDEFEVVFSGKDSLSKFRKDEDDVNASPQASWDWKS